MAMEAIKNAGVAYPGSAVKTQGKGQESEATTVIQQSMTSQETPEKNEAWTAGVDDDSETRIQSTETLKSAVSEINKRTNTEAIFGIHDATNRVMIKIIDKDSKKIIKEYPPEETLDMIAKVWEMAGILVDEKR